MFTDSSSLRRKEKHKRPPRAEPPVELVVLTRLRLLPFVPTQPRLFQFQFSQRLQVNEMLQVSFLLPPDAAPAVRCSIGAYDCLIPNRCQIETNAWREPEIG